MGKKNTTTNSYMSDVRRFADAFNYYVFDGEQVIRAEQLEPQDSTELSSALEEAGLEDIEKTRDLLKQCIIMKDDKLKPIITLILYWGSREWDGPRSLREMLDVKSEKLLQHINEYPLHLIVPSEIKDFSKMHTELKKALRYIAVSTDKNVYKALAVNPEYRVIDRETAHLLNTFMDTKIVIKESEAEVDVCEAVKGIINDAKDEGRIEGKIELISKKLSKGKSIGEIADALEEPEEVIEELIEKYNLTEK